MSVKKLIAIAIIYFFSFVAWMILGVSNLQRTDQAFSRLKEEVSNIFGNEITINAPKCYSKAEKQIIGRTNTLRKFFESDDVKLAKSDVHIKIHLDQRKKGNLWFPTFKANFSGQYEFYQKNKKNERHKYYLYFALNSANSIYNNIQLSINNEIVKDIMPLINKKAIEVEPTKDGRIQFTVSYECTGMEKLMYYISPDQDDISQINDFNLTIKTDFDDFDFAKNMMSPIEKNKVDTGYELIWKFDNSISGKDIGIVIPNKLNPGEIVSRVTFFAPISLLFFLIFLLVLAIVLETTIHPMHYFFLAATFFSFHLMFSYFSDHLNIYITFIIASLVSLALTITYLRTFTQPKLAYFYAPLTQFIYLVIFSYSFFFKGMTGLIVTICAVITLFILMQITAKVDWERVFNKNKL